MPSDHRLRANNMKRVNDAGLKSIEKSKDEPIEARKAWTIRRRALQDRQLLT